MLCFPNCKINIGLYITRRRKDRYHDIETIFYPASVAKPSAQACMQLHDVLEIGPSPATNLHTSGLAIGSNNNDNLVMKAYHLVKERVPSIVTDIGIFLQKNIPMGAGLGGGSADGAFMLMLLNNYFRLGLDEKALAAMALQLGSDCPFFVYNTPQFATGRGEKMTKVDLDLSGYSLQVICPKVHVSTAEAFSLIHPQPARYDLRKLPDLPVAQWKEAITNEFEIAVFNRHPVLAGVKELLYSQGALYASMSGSGSAIYGIFPKGSKAVVTANIGFDSFYLE